MTTTYPLDNRHDEAAGHHQAMSDTLDPITRGRILELVDLHRIGRCLEVGAGHGSIAYWLANQVGPEGEVVALDLKPEHVPEHPRLATVAHDLTADADLAPILGGQQFDLIHARLTLGHLPNRRTILSRLAGMLAPGGTLLNEDWAARWEASLDEVVLAAPSPEAAQLYHRYHQAAGRVFAAGGTDPTWAPRVCLAMDDAGLVDVATTIHGEYWRGGGPGLRIVRSAAAQIRPKLLATDLTEVELDELFGLFADSRLLVHPHLLYSTSGQRPAG